MNTTIKPMAVAVALAISTSGMANELALEEVVVTAQKREQNLNDVGISISAITGSQMKELGISDATEMAEFTPGLVLTETQPSGVPIYTIRGVGFDDYSVGSSSTVGVYVDEVALPYPTMTRGVMFDVARVEVLKGPQGTLYGRNSTGGAINFVSNMPGDEFEAGVSLDVGDDEYYKADVFVSGGLTDTLRGRLAVTTTQQDEGWQDSVSTGDKLGEKDELAGRVILQWDASDSVDVTFNAHGNTDKSDGPAAEVLGLTNTAVPVNTQPGLATTNDPTLYPVLAGLIGAELSPDFAGFADPLAYRANSSDPGQADWGLKPENDNTGYGGSVTLKWAIDDSYELVSISGYDKFERDEDQDWDGTPLGMWDSSMDSEIESFSQELRVNYEAGGDITWIAGLYYSTDTVEENVLGDVSNTGAGGGGLGFNAFSQKYDQDTDTVGVYGHAEWMLSDDFRLIVGGRYTDEERDWEGCTYDVGGDISWLYNNIFGLSKPGGAAFEPNECLTIDGSAVDPETFQVANPVFKDDISTQNFSGKLGLDYFATEDVLVYGSISSGFKSGGFNGSPANDWSQLQPYDEETLYAYELGVKATLLDGAMQLNGAAFYYDYEDKQVIDTVDTLFGPLGKLTNVPESEIMGLELEWQWRPLLGLDLSLSATYLDSEVKDYVDFWGEDLQGRDLAQTPEFQYNGIAAYEFPVSDGLSMRAMVNFNYSDGYYTLLGDSGGTVNYDDMQVDDWFVTNARITLFPEDSKWEVSLWGKNLGDEYYQQSLNFSNDVTFAMTGMGRTYGVNMTYYWD
jgi:iron complex outermembrane receptor protein